MNPSRSAPLAKNQFLGPGISLIIIFIISFAKWGYSAERPNILWITAEDMSPTLGCYGDNYANTPNIDRLRQDSIKYTHAFATSPVCSPSRACLINGLIASTQGSHQMRSTYPLPEYMLGFPKLLRDKGYFTSNNVKTDYNSGHAAKIIEASWDQNSNTAHWRNRKNEQPFFSIFNIMTSHQSRSMVWPEKQFKDQVQSKLSKEEIHNPEKAPIPPYYPDTPVIRKTVARYYDCVTAMDKRVGELLDQLKEDKLLDETIVFFYSDHGSGMPRHKRIPLDSGLQVPLLVSIPEKYKDLSPHESGASINRIVTFEDFGPTVLSLLGIDQPSYMKGVPFLGMNNGAPREYAFAHRDRIDEVIDMSRSVRNRRYLYVRNYMPNLSWNQQSAWPDQGEINHEFYKAGRDKTGSKLSPAQFHFVGPRKAREELYDCVADPQNLFNLANSPSHQKILSQMRVAHREYMVESTDLGFIPELELAKIASNHSPYQWARDVEYSPVKHMTAANLVGTSNISKMIMASESEDAGTSYWGVTALSALPNLNTRAVRVLNKTLDSKYINVALVSASALIHHNAGDTPKAFRILKKHLHSQDEMVVLFAARTTEMLGQKARQLSDDMKKVEMKYQETTSDIVYYIQFSTTGFLSRMN